MLRVDKCGCKETQNDERYIKLCRSVAVSHSIPLYFITFIEPYNVS